MDGRSCPTVQHVSIRRQHVEGDADARAGALEGDRVVVEVGGKQQHQAFLGPDRRDLGRGVEVEMGRRPAKGDPAGLAVVRKFWGLNANSR